MNLDDARSLADFINENNKRYHAAVLDFAERAWVIVSDQSVDNQKERFQEPIANPHDYLSRVNRGTLRIDPEYQRLLEMWLRSGHSLSVSSRWHIAETRV